MPSSRHWGGCRAVLGALLCLAVVAGCGSEGARPPAASFGAASENDPPGGGGKARKVPTPKPEPITLAVDRARSSAGVIAAGGGDAVYNYAPTLLVEDGKVRMWWCSQYATAAPAGDDILYAEAADIGGSFTGPDGGSAVAVFSGNPGGFDAVHTCDPSVIRVNGTYYMYYTGAAGDRTHGNSIGLATSSDGLNWHRVNGGKPIVGPAHDVHRDNVYGAGQPAAVYLDGWFYLMFTDTTGAAAGWNGAGQFVLRSTDPAFTTEVQSLGPQGFVPVSGTATQRTRSVVDAFSVDLMWVDALRAFAIAHETAEGTTITFYNRQFTRHPYRQVLLPGPWEEGPGLLRQPKGHAPISTTAPCGRVPIDVVRATGVGKAGAPSGLRHFGIDVHGIDGCARPAQALAVLDGFAMPSPVRTMDLVVAGKLVRVQRRSVAEALADRVLEHRPEVLDTVPVAAHLRAGAPVVVTPDGRTGVLLDGGKLWPLPDKTIAKVNDSPVRTISAREWESHQIGHPLGKR